MGTEIERKFLVKTDAWRKITSGITIYQGYLNRSKHKTVRVRLYGSHAYLTVKGITSGISRKEFEYEIPSKDAMYIIEHLCDKPAIKKTRFEITHRGKTWVVDEFHKENKGLIVAEVELESEHELFDKPDWIGTEVSGQPKYFNSNLIESPFSTW